jgi:TonB family protein
MKLVIFLMLLLSNNCIHFFHTNGITDDPPVLYLYTDKLPRFNYEGGLDKYIYSNIILPKVDVEGTVIVSFIVTKKGKVENIKIERGFGSEYNKELIRVFESMPLWDPGEVLSNPVDVIMYYPVKFIFK